MRVLLSVFACEPNRGAEPGNGWNLAWHLAQMDYEVWVLTTVDGKMAIEQALIRQPMPNMHFVYVYAPEWIKRYIKGQIGFFSMYLGWQQEAYKVAKQLDIEYDFEIVHHRTYGSITAGSQLWRLNKPFVFGPVGGGQVAPPAFKQYFGDRWYREALRSFLNQQLIGLNRNAHKTVSRADLVLVANQDTFNMAQRLGAQRVELFIPGTGLSEDYFPKEIPSRSQVEELRILWVGSLHPRKALPLALEALSQVNHQIPLKITILGGGPLGHLVWSWIEEYSLEKRVEYRGQVSWQEVKTAYLEHDVFLFTSLRDTFGAQLLEAMANALPIISLNHQGAGDAVPEGAGIKVSVTYPAETVKALAQAIEYMFNHPHKRSEMGKVGYAFAKTQTWTKRGRKISDYYQELSKNKK